MPKRLTERDVQRGKRLAEIRGALDLTQEAIVDRLNAAAAQLGTGKRYKYYSVSRMEGGSIDFDDAAAWIKIAPPSMRITWEWFVFGVAAKAAARPDVRASTSRRVG